MSISRINSIDYYYTAISTGKRINSAADDAAGLAISQKLTSQIKGTDKATQNALDAQSMLKTAEGSLTTITDSLHRMRELSLQASNSFYTSSDKRHIQNEIDELKSHIANTVDTANFNTKNLFDQNNSDFFFAVSSNGSGETVSMGGALLQSLGIADFDVTKAFDIGDIDKALDTVSSITSGLGASYNRFEYTIESNLNSSLNLQNANSRIADADIGMLVSDMKKAEVMDYYKLYMQKKARENNENLTKKSLTSI